MYHFLALLASLPILCTCESLPASLVDSYSSLSVGFDDVLDENVLERVKEEVEKMQKAGDIYERGDMKFGKRPTTWVGFPLSQPRNFIESAILEFYDLAVPEDFYTPDYTVEHYGELRRYKKEDIKGAEWWIQERGSKEGIGFHYDKDEAYASLQMRMSFPILSTITYLTSTGAPTLILNQTSLDGSIEYPEVPSTGFLSYPQENRHVIFRGDLNHGVSKSLSLDDEGGERVTLLVNWWVSKPLEPNCMILTDDLATKVGINYPSKVSSYVGKSGGSKTVVNSGSDIPFLNVTGAGQKDKRYKRHKERFPPNDAFYYDMPKSRSLVKGSMYAISWGEERVFGHTGMLDLWNTQQVSGIFRSKLPKLIVFVHDVRDLDSPTGINWWLQPLAKRHSEVLKVYTATSEQRGAWEAFGLKEGDIPTAVVHWTGEEERKFVAEREGTFGMDKVSKLLRDAGVVEEGEIGEEL